VRPRYFARKEHRKVVLYSNDRNLCNKCMVHHIDAFGSVDQLKFQKLVDNAQVRSTAYKKALSVSTPHAPSTSRSDTGVTEVMSQVHSRPSTSYRSTEATHKSHSYSLEGSSARDSIHAPKSKSKRLQEANSRQDSKSETRSWNMAALERHRSKKESKSESKQRPHATEDRLHSQNRYSEPKPILNDDNDDCAMDVDDEYPPPMPEGTSDSIHARNLYY
jgi:hypothetical protein